MLEAGPWARENAPYLPLVKGGQGGFHISEQEYYDCLVLSTHY